MKRLFFLLLVIIFLIQQIVVLPGCANIIPPEGGPRDTIPPVLLKAEPGDSARNFKGNKIVFTFDEFVDIQNISENLLVSPLPKINPSVDFKLKTVTVKLKDTLEPGTTYQIDFGNAIKDFTEGNPVKGFSYTFSTGASMDSLELKGNVTLAETGKIDSTLIVMLHSNADDSAVAKTRPRYVAKLDGKGNFVFKNLPSKTFYLYALKNESGTYFYSGDKQLFAFADKPVTVKTATEPVKLYAYASAPALPATTAAAPSLNIGNRRRVAETVDKRLKYQTNLVNDQQDLMTNFSMTFEQPLRKFDSTRMRLYTDSTFNEDSFYHVKKEGNNKKITLTTEWKENTLYHIIFDKDFGEDSAGKKLLKTDTLSFKTKKFSEYGSLKIKFRNLPLDKNPVLLIVQNESIYKSFPLSSTEFSQRLFLPGEFELRMLYDNNKNGKWDSGDFFGKHLQTEIVKPVERRITVKAAWQNEFEIAL